MKDFTTIKRVATINLLRCFDGTVTPRQNAENITRFDITQDKKDKLYYKSLPKKLTIANQKTKGT